LNQDELLERLWVEVINAVEGVAPMDVQHVARMARYEALFGWCHAFDEKARTVAWWLKKPAEDPLWFELSSWPAEAAGRRRKVRPDRPFADSEEARMRLLDTGTTGEALAELMTTQGRLAVAQLREILASRKWKSGELAGLHEGLLSADPSGLEGRPGSWPASSAKAKPSRRGPRLTLKKSHALAFSLDGKRVVAAKGGAITEVSSGRVLAKCELLAHTSHVAWSPGGTWIAGQSTSGDIAVCAADTGKRVRVLSQKGEGVAPLFTTDSELIGANWGGVVLRWDVEEGKLLGGVRLPVSMLHGLAQDEDGEPVVLVRREAEGMACLRLDPELKTCLSSQPVPPWAYNDSLDNSRGRALLAGQSHFAWLDLETGTMSKPFDDFGPIVDCSVSPDGKWVAFANLRAFRIALAEDLAAGRTYAMEYANRATFSEDSRQIALGTWNAGEVWDVEALFRVAS
jgi:hypothetical protein